MRGHTLTHIQIWKLFGQISVKMHVMSVDERMYRYNLNFHVHKTDQPVDSVCRGRPLQLLSVWTLDECVTEHIHLSILISYLRVLLHDRIS